MNKHIEASHLSQAYGKTTVLSDFSLTLHPGITALLGPNGAGKTTLMDILATAALPQEGTVSYSGQTPIKEKDRLKLREKIGYLPQHFSFSPSYRVRDVLEYVCWSKKFPASQRDTAIKEALEKVDLHDKASARLRTLSGGMRQRLGIAQAILTRPHYLFLDEPTVGLDPEQRIQFREVISCLEECVVILSTHLTEDAALCANRVIVLNKGKVGFDGEVAELEAMRPDEDIEGMSRIEQGYLHVLRSHHRTNTPETPKSAPMKEARS